MSRIHIVSQRVTPALLNSSNNHGKKLKEGEKELSLVTLFRHSFRQILTSRRGSNEGLFKKLRANGEMKSGLVFSDLS